MGLPARTYRYIRHRLSRPNPKALWVFGMQKSGTSAIAGLLAAKTGKSVQLDTKYLWEPYRNRLLAGEISLGELVSRYSYDFSKEILKEPAATFFIDLIESYFELRQYVFIVRNPYDTLRSILNRLGLPGDRRDIDLEDVVPRWRHLYREKQGRDYIATMAKRWVQANAQLDRVEDKRCVLVKYEDFKADKEQCIERLAEDLGLPLQNSIAHLVDKNFQPRGDSGIDPKAFFGSRNYGIITDICGELMEYYGYRS